MEIQEYLEKECFIQNNLLDYLDNENGYEEYFENLMNFLIEQQIKDDRFELKSLFQLITKISNNHHRTINFFDKIEQIIITFKELIKTFFSNYEIFNIFKSNKRILLFLFEEKILTPDLSIFNTISTYKYQLENYPEYFFPEFQSFYDQESIDNVKVYTSEDDFEKFKQNRKIGENEKDVCSLIRSDSIEDFIAYINKTNLPFSSTIFPSIFETNAFIIDKCPSLIEYAAFFGSIQIFKYLHSNQVKLTPSLWFYGIHGNNPEIIEFLKENKISPPNSSFDNCLVETIKCHHLDATNFIRDDFIENLEEKEFDFFLQSIKYFNYYNFRNNELNNFDAFFEFCKYGHFYIVQLFMKSTDFDINSSKVQNLFIECNFILFFPDIIQNLIVLNYISFNY